MKKAYITTIFTLFGLLAANQLSGQGFLFGYPNVGGGGQIVSVDLQTCQTTVISNITQSGNFTDFVQMPNGNIYLLGFSGGNPAVLLLDPPSGTFTVLAGLGSAPIAGGMLPLSDSTILITTYNNFFIYNINTNVVDNIGSINGFSGFGEMFWYNGQIYATQTSSGYPPGVYQVQLSPLSVTLSTIPLVYGAGPLTSVCDNLIAPEPVVSQVDPVSGSLTTLCNISFGGGGGFSSTAPDPFNTTGPLCNCITDAGHWTNGNNPAAITICGQGSAPLPHAGDEVLDGDDNLVFVLTNTTINNNYPNNILAVFDDPEVSFVPGVTQFNTIYRVYAIAANQDANGIDYFDPCRDIEGTPVLVQWVPLPAVTFSVLSQDCGTGCQTIQANFTGAAPYSLNWQIVTSDGTSGPFTTSSGANSTTLNVCAPPGYAGPLTVQAISLTGGSCICD